MESIVFSALLATKESGMKNMEGAAIIRSSFSFALTCKELGRGIYLNKWVFNEVSMPNSVGWVSDAAKCFLFAPHDFAGKSQAFKQIDEELSPGHKILHGLSSRHPALFNLIEDFRKDGLIVENQDHRHMGVRLPTLTFSEDSLKVIFDTEERKRRFFAEALSKEFDEATGNNARMIHQTLGFEEPENSSIIVPSSGNHANWGDW